jgi:glucose/arabinose dehydrogenase
VFPAKYRGAIFISRHRSWKRSKIFGGDIVVAWLDGKGAISKMEPFLTGFVENNQYLGRPVDVMQMKDDSLLVSDDHAGAIYRISYRK